MYHTDRTDAFQEALMVLAIGTLLTPFAPVLGVAIATFGAFIAYGAC